MAAPSIQIFNHTDHRLQYGGNWKGIHNATPGALATSNDPNANVTFILPSRAISFKYYGMRTRFGLCIDCNLKNPYFVPNGAVNQTDDGKGSPALLYSQRFAPPGISAIAIQNIPNSGPSNDPSFITVDHFEIVPANVPSPRKAPIGAIVGGAVGGAVGLLVFGAVIFYFWWRRKNRRRITECVGERGFDPSPTTNEPPKPTPLTQMRGTTTVMNGKSGLPENTHLQALSSRPETPRREVDAGPVDDDSNNDTRDELLPPDYEHVFQNAGSGSTEATSGTRRGKR